MRHPPAARKPRDAETVLAACSTGDVLPAAPVAVPGGDWIAVAELDFRSPVCASLGAIDVVAVLAVDGATAHPSSARRGARVAVRLPLAAATAEEAAAAAVEALASVVQNLAQPVLWEPGSVVVRPAG